MLLKFLSWNLSPEGGGNAHVTWLHAECTCLLNTVITSLCHMLTLCTCRTVLTWLGNAPHAGISVLGAKLVCPSQKPSQRATHPPLITLSGGHRQPQTTNRRKSLVQSTPPPSHLTQAQRGRDGSAQEGLAVKTQVCSHWRVETEREADFLPDSGFS